MLIRTWGGSAVVLVLGIACGGGRGEANDSDATESSASGDTAPGTADESGEPPPVPVATVAELLVPFDTNTMDIEGPGSWATQYGKSPEIVAVSHDRTIDVLVQDYAAGPSGRAYVLRLEPLEADYVVTAVLEPPLLDRIMGLARDANDNIYVASGIEEDSQLTLEYPAPGEHRSGIVQLVKLAWDGALQFDTDVDLARGAVQAPELVINPMVAATSRLAVGGGTVALLHGINTDPDDEGIRHQKALATHVDTLSGEVTRSESVWVSHSFDQRLFHDGNAFIEMHLGDAFPRDIVLARVEPDSGPYPLLYIKGETGANNTFTRLGNAALIDGDPTYGYLALFATESTPDTDAADGGTIAGSRELAVVRVRRDFYAVDSGGTHLDASMPDTFDVQSGAEARTNRLRWLTRYQVDSAGQTHAERPKLVPLGDDTYAVLWERWDGGGATFGGTWGMIIDADGTPQVNAAMLTDAHLPRGDDAFTLDGEAAWITGDAAARQLHIHVIDAQLSYRRIIVD